ncbi:SH3 domain-containing protein [Pseudomonas sp. SB113]|uniref:SH3 domain-containing protein n=1 Tax=Pseudomonas sp. SB113 TaxID=3154123 RepID=UPI00345D1653
MDNDKRKSLAETVASIQNSIRHPALENIRTSGIGETVRRMQEASAASVALNHLGNNSFFKAYKDSFGAVAALTSSAQLDRAKKTFDSIGLIGELSRKDNIALLERYRGFSFGADWVEQHKNSALFGFLTSFSSQKHDSISLEYFDVDAQVVDIESSEFVKPPKVEPKLEAEIVEVLQAGRSFSELSNEALAYLEVVWAWLWGFLNKAAIIITLVTGFIALAALNTAATPKDVRDTVSSIPAETRVLLEGNSAVIGDHVIVRAGPDKRSEELARLKIGTLVENLGGDTDSWTRVQVEVGEKEITGWIARRYLLEF